MAVTCDPVKLPCGSDTCPATLQCLWTGNNGGAGIIPEVVYATLVFVGVVGMAMVIFAGFRFITSQADKKTLEGARKTILYAVFGLAVVVFSFFFMNILGMATGVTCLEPINVLTKGLNACK